MPEGRCGEHGGRALASQPPSLGRWWFTQKERVGFEKLRAPLSCTPARHGDLLLLRTHPSDASTRTGCICQGAIITGSVASGLGFSLRDRGNESFRSRGPASGTGRGGWGRVRCGLRSVLWGAGLLGSSQPGFQEMGLRRRRDHLRRGQDDSLPGARPPAAAISQRAWRPRWHGRYRSLPPRNTRVPGPAEIGSEREQLPDGFASKIKQEQALSSSSLAPRPRPSVNGYYSVL